MSNIRDEFTAEYKEPNARTKKKLQSFGDFGAILEEIKKEMKPEMNKVQPKKENWSTTYIYKPEEKK